MFDIARNHVATASKDTTFLDNYGCVITPELGQQLREWLCSGKDPERCANCEKVIKPTRTKSVKEIVEGTSKKAGKPLCMGCYSDWVKSHEEERNNSVGEN